jgi:hypothetical protein
MRSSILVVTLAALAAVAVPSAGADVISSPSPMFDDPVGDVTGAPDVTQVAVLNDPTDTLRFWVTTIGEPVLQDSSVIELRFDIDANPSTGSANGVERLVHRLWTGSTRLCTWNGASFSCASSPGVTSTYVDGLLAVTATTAALGVVGPFDFSVAAYRSPNVDFAPDAGAWRYQVGPPSTGCAAAPAGIECVTTGPPRRMPRRG